MGWSDAKARVISLLLASVLAIAAAPALAAAQHPHNRPKAEPTPAPAEVLSQIHTYGGRPAPFALDAREELLVAGHTGTVLYAWNEHQKIQPASLAKIMTFYLTLEALKNGKINPNTMVTISEQAWRLSMDQTVSKMFLEVGQQVSVHDLLIGLMVSSGNDAAMALAEYLGGSREAFVQMMNDEGEKLGLTETHFGSPDGLPEPNQYTTAADMVKLANILITRHPEAIDYTSIKEFTFHKITQRNWNTLIFYDSRVTGLKTGHVDEAGFHLVATANSNGLWLISALMGAPNAEKRRTETEKLLDWAFRAFTTVTPDWHSSIPNVMKVYQGTAESVAVAPEHTPAVTVAKGEDSQLKFSGQLDARYLVAPVRKGERVGQLTFMKGDQILETIPVVAQAAVPRGGFFKVIRDRLRMIF